MLIGVLNVFEALYSCFFSFVVFGNAFIEYFWNLKFSEEFNNFINLNLRWKYKNKKIFEKRKKKVLKNIKYFGKKKDEIYEKKN